MKQVHHFIKQASHLAELVTPILGMLYQVGRIGLMVLIFAHHPAVSLPNLTTNQGSAHLEDRQTP